MPEITNADLREDILDVKGAVLSLRGEFVDFKDKDFTDLKNHVNHEREAMMEIIGQKQDSNSLLTSIGFKLLQNQGVRWALGVVAFTILGTIVSAHWLPLLDKIVEGLGTF